MQDEFISTEHLLLAIAEEKDGEAGKILRQHGVKRDDLLKGRSSRRAAVRELPIRTRNRTIRHFQSTRAISRTWRERENSIRSLAATMRFAARFRFFRGERKTIRF